jgi:exosortase
VSYFVEPIELQSSTDRALADSKSSVPVASRPTFGGMVALAFLVGVVVWAYWPTFVRLVQIWWSDPQYSHGFLVPFFAAALCWMRRDRVDWSQVHGAWWALGLVVLGMILRLVGGYFFLEWFEHVSLLLVVAGLVGIAGGWSLLRAWWPAAAFLIFMIPFPYRIQVLLSDPLQRLATVATCYILQTFGEPAVAIGNTILVNDTQLEVVQACNGLRMAVSFLALSVAVALVTRRPLWERWLLLINALPIAVLSNVVRITVTGLLSNHVDPHVAEVFFHDVAGWLMMPFALALMIGQFWLVDWVLTRPPGETPIRVSPTELARAAVGSGGSAQRKSGVVAGRPSDSSSVSSTRKVPRKANQKRRS